MDDNRKNNPHNPNNPNNPNKPGNPQPQQNPQKPHNQPQQGKEHPANCGCPACVAKRKGGDQGERKPQDNRQR